MITWYDLQIPEFNIDYEPRPVLITSADDTLFFIDAINFSLDNIRDYSVTWTISPELPDETKKQILSYGKVMQIEKGSYSKNTDYTVELTITHNKLDKVTNSEQI